MTVQLNIQTEHDPIIGQHWSTVDTEHLVARHMYYLACELREIGAQIPVAKLFVLEALGYQVDLDTGTVTNAE